MVWVLEVNNFYLGNFIWEIFSLNIMPYWFAICCVVGKRRKDIANFEIILYQQCGLAQHTELLRTVHALLLYLVKKKKKKKSLFTRYKQYFSVSSVPLFMPQHMEMLTILNGNLCSSGLHMKILQHVQRRATKLLKGCRACPVQSD